MPTPCLLLASNDLSFTSSPLISSSCRIGVSGSAVSSTNVAPSRSTLCSQWTPRSTRLRRPACQARLHFGDLPAAWPPWQGSFTTRSRANTSWRGVGIAACWLPTFTSGASRSGPGRPSRSGSSVGGRWRWSRVGRRSRSGSPVRRFGGLACRLRLARFPLNLQLGENV